MHTFCYHHIYPRASSSQKEVTRPTWASALDPLILGGGQLATGSAARRRIVTGTPDSAAREEPRAPGWFLANKGRGGGEGRRGQRAAGRVSAAGGKRGTGGGEPGGPGQGYSRRSRRGTRRGTGRTAWPGRAGSGVGAGRGLRERTRARWPGGRARLGRGQGSGTRQRAGGSPPGLALPAPRNRR